MEDHYRLLAFVCARNSSVMIKGKELSESRHIYGGQKSISRWRSGSTANRESARLTITHNNPFDSSSSEGESFDEEKRTRKYRTTVGDGNDERKIESIPSTQQRDDQQDVERRKMLIWESFKHLRYKIVIKRDQIGHIGFEYYNMLWSEIFPGQSQFERAYARPEVRGTLHAIMRRVISVIEFTNHAFMEELSNSSGCLCIIEKKDTEWQRNSNHFPVPILEERQRILSVGSNMAMNRCNGNTGGGGEEDGGHGHCLVMKKELLALFQYALDCVNQARSALSDYIYDDFVDMKRVRKSQFRIRYERRIRFLLDMCCFPCDCMSWCFCLPCNTIYSLSKCFCGCFRYKRVRVRSSDGSYQDGEGDDDDDDDKSLSTKAVRHFKQRKVVYLAEMDQAEVDLRNNMCSVMSWKVMNQCFG